MTESPIPEQLRRLREALGAKTGHGSDATLVVRSDLAWALERLDEAREALRPFSTQAASYTASTADNAALWVDVHLGDLRRASAIADKIGG